jgi:4-oxalocrotonate tautomerase
VDDAGVFHSRRHRDHSLLYFAKARAEGVSWMLAGCSIRICVLPTLWNVSATHLPELRPCRGARLGELPELRDKVAGTIRSRRLTGPDGTEDCGVILIRSEHFPSQVIPGRMQAEHEEASVPYVQVTWVEGRTPEQKRKLAERITQVLVEDGRAKRENIQVTFVDLPATDYAEAGVTVADQKRPPTP